MRQQRTLHFTEDCETSNLSTMPQRLNTKVRREDSVEESRWLYFEDK